MVARSTIVLPATGVIRTDLRRGGKIRRSCADTAGLFQFISAARINPVKYTTVESAGEDSGLARTCDPSVFVKFARVAGPARQRSSAYQVVSKNITANRVGTNSDSEFLINQNRRLLYADTVGN